MYTLDVLLPALGECQREGHQLDINLVCYGGSIRVHHMLVAAAFPWIRAHLLETGSTGISLPWAIGTVTRLVSSLYGSPIPATYSEQWELNSICSCLSGQTVGHTVSFNQFTISCGENSPLS